MRLILGASQRLNPQRLLKAATLGIQAVDTARSYVSDSDVARYAREYGLKVHAKVSPVIANPERPWLPIEGKKFAELYPYEYVKSQIQEVNQRYGSAVDTIYFHVWSDGMLDSTVRKVRREFPYRRLGVSAATGNPQDCVQSIGSGLFDVVQVQYNLFRWEECEDLLQMAKVNQVEVVARSPLEAGALMHRHQVTGWRKGFLSNRADEINRRRKILRKMSVKHELSSFELAVRFVLSEPRIGSVLIGASRGWQIAEMAECVVKGPLSSVIHQKVLDESRGLGFGRDG